MYFVYVVSLCDDILSVSALLVYDGQHGNDSLIISWVYANVLIIVRNEPIHLYVYMRALLICRLCQYVKHSCHKRC